MTDKQTQTETPRRRVAALIPPMLAPNKILGLDIPITEDLFPCSVSKKYNGIRGLAMNGGWYSRSGKELKIHPILLEQFAQILDYATRENLVLDGEFQSNSHNTVGETRSILAGKLPTPEDFKFKCFYTIPYSVWNCVVPATMNDLLAWDLPCQRYHMVRQEPCDSKADFLSLVEEHLHMNIEGFMLLRGSASYKHGRVTLNEGHLLKFKYYAGMEDAKIIGLTPRRERRAGILSQSTPLGYAQQPYAQSSFHETDIAGCIQALMEDGSIIHTPFPVGWTLPERQRAYLAFGSGDEADLKGEWISFRRLACEDRDKPISIKGVTLRDSKD